MGLCLAFLYFPIFDQVALPMLRLIPQVQKGLPGLRILQPQLPHQVSQL